MEAKLPNKQLEAFLIANNAYGQYMENLKRYSDKHKLNFNGVLARLANKSGWLCFYGSFVFSETPEGYHYWFELADKFDKTVGYERFDK